MRERPLLFSDPMVRALLSGQKTQTRRVVKPQPDGIHAGIPFINGHGQGGTGTRDRFIRCPYGQPGDRLWVREAFHAYHWDKPRAVYRADGERQRVRTQIESYEVGRWKPSIHMPRWACRLVLEIVNVRVERLQDISEEDAEAEGVDFLRHVPDADETLTAKQLFECLWSGINGAESWAANPWVWVVEFRRVQP